MSELCEELIMDILLRLPVKSLLRFRCVSKLWCELIDSKYFISMHCQQSINSNTNFHLIFQKHLDNLYSYSEYFDDDGLNRSLTTIDNPMKCSTIGSCSCKVMFCSVVGCCNGLLCIYHSDFDYVLWNPFTRRYNKLPQAPELVFAPAKKQILHGFGYDHENDDYKVLRIFQIFDPDDFDGKDSIIRNQICVYSLRMNSWKHIEDYPYGDYNYEFQDNHGQGCFVNGASHWLVYPLILNENECQVQGLKWAIVAFNFEVEKFSTIPHPNANRYGEGIQIENLGGFLCICEEVCGTCEVWVMKQYGVGESWVKLHSLKLKYLNIDPALFLKPLAYSKKGENLLMKTDFDALTKYNLKEETSSIIRFPKIVGWGYCYMCLESLVSPHNGGDEGIAAQ